MPGVLHMKLNELEITVIIFPGFLEKCRHGYVRAIGLFTSFSSTEKISKGQEKNAVGMVSGTSSGFQELRELFYSSL